MMNVLRGGIVMKKIGILTYHFSNNFGGVLQSYALYQYLMSEKINVEIINYIPSKYKNDRILHSTGLRKNIFKSKKEDINPMVLFKRVMVKIVYNRRVIKKFDTFKKNNMKLSNRVDERSITSLLKDYMAIIVGSDQIWNPGQRNKKEYFLGFDDLFKGKKISYAADSTISEINTNQINKLMNALEDFDAISVRNEHTHKFVQTLTGKSVPIVVDPTLLCNFDNFIEKNNSTSNKDVKYILVYALGKEINGTNKKAIERIKEIYGNLKVYSIVIPTMKFNICNYADEVLYDLGPKEWINMFKKASFIYTDSYHGTLFSLKFHKPFLAYYAEDMRSTRFKDLGKRYQIDKYIVNGLDEIDSKNSINTTPDFGKIDKLIESHRKFSVNFLNKALNSD